VERMFKNWFAQYNWQGLAFLNFVIISAVMYAWWTLNLKRAGKKTVVPAWVVKVEDLLVPIAIGVVVVNVVLWILGLRY